MDCMVPQMGGNTQVSLGFVAVRRHLRLIKRDAGRAGDFLALPRSEKCRFLLCLSCCARVPFRIYRSRGDGSLRGGPSGRPPAGNTGVAGNRDHGAPPGDDSQAVSSSTAHVAARRGAAGRPGPGGKRRFYPLRHPGPDLRTNLRRGLRERTIRLHDRIPGVAVGGDRRQGASHLGSSDMAHLRPGDRNGSKTQAESRPTCFRSGLRRQTQWKISGENSKNRSPGAWSGALTPSWKAAENTLRPSLRSSLSEQLAST